MADSFSLIWLPWSGKTTLGKKVAKQFGWEFCDFDDDVIEWQTGLPVAKNLEKLWESGFKQLEQELASNIKLQTSTIISTSGSLPYSEKAMNHLTDLGPRVYLKPPMEEILQRCHSMKVDRIIGMGDKTLEEILTERADLYRQYADITFAYTGTDTDQISEKLTKKLWTHFFHRYTKTTDTGTLNRSRNHHDTLYDIVTFAEKYRGGKIYSEDKIVKVLSGKALLIEKKDGEDTERMITPKRWYTIKAGTPHIFYFPVETHMTEQFPRKTQIENFQEYRNLKK